MNLQYLFEIQAGLDRHIEDEHPRKDGEDRLSDKILALQVELGELANEWRGFKFWSKNQEPRRYKEDFNLETNRFRSYDPLLEEYVDCLHFILSIGLELKVNVDTLKEYFSPKKMLHITDHFLWTNKKLIDLYENFRDRKSSNAGMLYLNLFNSLIGLGEMLGFTWEEIEQAYLEKNKVNHERQVNGY